MKDKKWKTIYVTKGCINTGIPESTRNCAIAQAVSNSFGNLEGWGSDISGYDDMSYEKLTTTSDDYEYYKIDVHDNDWEKVRDFIRVYDEIPEDEARLDHVDPFAFRCKTKRIARKEPRK